MPPPPVKPTGNYAEYPCRPMHITQAYIGESHTGHSTGTPHDWPIDDNGIGGTRNYFYCPCDKMKIKRIYGVGKTGVNTIWMQSLEPVKLANGKTDFLVVMVIHPDDEDLLKLYEGQDVTRGQAMFREGTDGANNYHQHISCGLGDIVGTGWLNVPGTKYFVINTTNGPIKAEEVFYVDTSKTTILQTEGLVFKTF